MKAAAEEDYVSTVDDMAMACKNDASQEWARNVQENNYSVSLFKTFDKFDIHNCEIQCLLLGTTLEYWCAR